MESAPLAVFKMDFTVQSPGSRFDFVKPGAHLGALGCVVQDVESSSSS